MAIGPRGRGPNRRGNITVRRIDLPKGTDALKFIEHLKKTLSDAGWTPMDANDPKVKKMLTEIDNKMSKESIGLGAATTKTKKKTAVKAKKKAAPKKKATKAKTKTKGKK